MTQPRLLGGRYELDGVVGRGGMAEVYRARDIRLDRQVAVKTLRADLARDPTFQARFRREAQSAASLNHPSIIAVYDTGEDAASGTPIPYIVMEYVEGRTLRELLQHDRRLLPERALEIVDGILRALDYSHRNGIIHRDIKPANVVLTRTGEVKVMDFGIARAVRDSQATMTQTAQVIGTAQYLSPEQARGERVDSRSDLYSTGCLLYELLTGRPPFTGDSPVAIAYQHVRENPVPPSQLDPEIPPWADAIVLKAMAKQPEQRYQSAAEMRADIQRALSGAPVQAPTAVLSPTRQLGPTRVEPASRTAALPPYQYGETAPAAKPPSNRRRVIAWTLFALLLIGGAALAGYFLLGNRGADQVQVPQVVGMAKDAAVRQLESLELRPSVQEEFSSDQEKGNVTRTDPPAQTSVPKGSTVTVYVSKGTEQVTVPPLIGLQQSDAEKALQAAGLKSRVETRASGEARGTVIDSDPSAGKRVDKGSTVTLTVSGGIEKIPVPNVVNMSVDDARNQLQQAGFRVNVVNVPRGDVEAGKVFQQDPKAGKPVDKGTTVTIFVAVPPPTESASPTPPSPTPPGDSGGGFPFFPRP